MEQGRPVWAEVDLDAVEHNIREIRRHIGSHAQIMAVVKANAYGHGAVPVARAALLAGASQLGVACVDEGVQLRGAGIDAPVVVLGYVPPWEADAAVGYGLSPSVTTQDTALALERAAAKAGKNVGVHVKVDTGMARLGLLPTDVPDFVRLLATLPHLTLVGLYTHFASADEADKSFTRQQFRAFMEVSRRIESPALRHVANSAAVSDLAEMALDMVRPGIAIYGCYPSTEVTHNLNLRPALSLKSRIVRIASLAPGETVSYGRTWRAKRPSRIALVPCGYADGVPRLLSNKGSVLVRGQRAAIAGRVCMDHLMVDVTGIPDAAMHDEVVLIGRQGAEVIPVEEVAKIARTINYEVLCAITPRVPRCHLRQGKVVERQSLVEHTQFTPTARVEATLA